MRKCFSHEITVALPLDQAMPLFSPKGEERWEDDWHPVYVAPATGETCREMVFTTEHGGEHTIWTCLDWQPEHGHVRYFRATPGSRVAFVDVQCTPAAGGTRVHVTYDIHTLTAAGESYLAALTEARFAEMIDSWENRIADAA
ncbi:MAG: SRPBCC family protein [Hyphomicrobiales bacterium]|nr:SRPBCC family protein [Hyphomicrobiales bacterium]